MDLMLDKSQLNLKNIELSMQLSRQTSKKVSQPSGKVQVILRVRPLLHTEDPEQFITVNGDHKHNTNQNMVKNLQTISLNRPGNTAYMKFAHVVNGKTTQQSLFITVKDTVRGLLNGLDGTIFAYGQTGAGKTFTMIGQCPQDTSNFIENRFVVTNQNRGVLPRALQLIMDQGSRIKGSRISISFYQIYNDKIYDLLSSSLKPLDLRQSKLGDITIEGLLTIQITNLNEAINHLATGIKNRVTSSTQGNIKSSRSHSVFQIKYQCRKSKNSSSNFIHNTLRIVDLAGSQKFNIPHDLSQTERQIRIQQLKCINMSLSKLGHCISALTSQTRTHIPFRQSKLTRILSDSLLGSAQIRLFICISPSISAQQQSSQNRNQTLSTLSFANQVKKAIFQRPTMQTHKKKYVDYQEHRLILQQLEKQRKTRESLQKALKLTVGEKQFNQHHFELATDNEYLKKQIMHLKQQLKVYANQSKQKITHNNLKGNKPKMEVKNKSNYIYKNKNLQPYFLTPPKTSTANSIYQNTSLEVSQDVYDSDNIRKKLILNSSKEKSSRLANGNIKSRTKISFTDKIKRFMDRSTEKDKQVDQKIKRRLQQIKKQIKMNCSSKQNKYKPEIYISGDDDNISDLWKK